MVTLLYYFSPKSSSNNQSIAFPIPARRLARRLASGESTFCVWIPEMHIGDETLEVVADFVNLDSIAFGNLSLLTKLSARVEKA